MQRFFKNILFANIQDYSADLQEVVIVRQTILQNEIIKQQLGYTSATNSDVIIDFSQKNTTLQDILSIPDILNLVCRYLSPKKISALSFTHPNIYKLINTDDRIQKFLSFFCDQLYTAYRNEFNFLYSNKQKAKLGCPDSDEGFGVEFSSDVFEYTAKELIQETNKNKWFYKSEINYLKQLLKTISELEKKEVEPEMSLLAKILFLGKKARFLEAVQYNRNNEKEIFRRGRWVLLSFLILLCYSCMEVCFNSSSSAAVANNFSDLIVKFLICAGFLIPTLNIAQLIIATGPTDLKTPTCLLEHKEYLFFKSNAEIGLKMGKIANVVYLGNEKAFQAEWRQGRSADAKLAMGFISAIFTLGLIGAVANSDYFSLLLFSSIILCLTRKIVVPQKFEFAKELCEINESTLDIAKFVKK